MKDFFKQFSRFGLFVIVFVNLLGVGFYTNIFQTLYPTKVARVAGFEFPEVLRLYDLDWIPAKIAIRSLKRSIIFSSTEFSVRSNEQLGSYKIPAGWQLLFIDEFEGNYYYILKTSAIADGQSKFNLYLRDISGNELIKEVEISAEPGRSDVISWPDVKYSMHGDDLLARVNKQYRLPEDYEPVDLVALSDLQIKNANAARVRGVMVADLTDMTNELKAANIDFTITSAYRSYADQVRAFATWVGYNQGSIEAADRVSARPGHSEHQLGTTLDFITSENGGIFYLFETTRLSLWLHENAWKFGFVKSYPQGSEQITGYSYEPWHYRYVGKENAKLVKESGVTLTEWLAAQQNDV